MNYSTQKCSIKKSLSGTSYLLRKFRAYILIKPFNVYLKTLIAVSIKITFSNAKSTFVFVMMFILPARRKR